MTLSEKIKNREYDSRISSVDYVQYKLHVEDCRRLNAKFKKDALEEVGLTGHKNADKAFELASTMIKPRVPGYPSYPYQLDILSGLEKLAELML